jgi:hypothetical protein
MEKAKPSKDTRRMRGLDSAWRTIPAITEMAVTTSLSIALSAYLDLMMSLPGKFTIERGSIHIRDNDQEFGRGDATAEREPLIFLRFLVK